MQFTRDELHSSFWRITFLGLTNYNPRSWRITIRAPGRGRRRDRPCRLAPDGLTVGGGRRAGHDSEALPERPCHQPSQNPKSGRKGRARVQVVSNCPGQARARAAIGRLQVSGGTSASGCLLGRHWHLQGRGRFLEHRVGEPSSGTICSTGEPGMFLAHKR